MRKAIEAAIAGSSADYTDVRIERRWGTRVKLKKGRIDALESSTEFGGVVRCLRDGGWGVSVFNDVSLLCRYVEEAARMAEIVGLRTTDPARLAETPAVQDESRAELEDDFRNIALSRKVDLAGAYNRILSEESDRIVSAEVHYADRFSEITFANSEGTFLIQELPDITLSLQATASDGKSNIQQGHVSFGRAGGLDAVLGHENEARDTARRAVAMLDARPVRGGQYVVILDQELAGVFIHEAFGHLCEADLISRNPQVEAVMTWGRAFGVPELQVVDDGYMPGLRGNVPYDDEGVRRSKTYLLKDGCLSSLMHSRETAARMGATPTGNARATGYEYRPIVRMTNTYIENGKDTFAEMIRGVERGIYAKQFYGGQTALEQFSFSAGYAHEIVDGEVGGLLRNVVLSGNLFETLHAIDAIGNDRHLHEGDGGCGKANQMGLPTPVGSPHIRIRNVTIGGQG